MRLGLLKTSSDRWAAKLQQMALVYAKGKQIIKTQFPPGEYKKLKSRNLTKIKIKFKITFGYTNGSNWLAHGQSSANKTKPVPSIQI